MMQQSLPEYVVRNRTAYRKMALGLELEHPNRIALFHEGELAGTFEDEEKAYIEGVNRYGLGNFCIFPIGRDRVVQVGSLAVRLHGSDNAVKDDAAGPAAHNQKRSALGQCWSKSTAAQRSGIARISSSD